MIINAPQSYTINRKSISLLNLENHFRNKLSTLKMDKHYILAYKSLLLVKRRTKPSVIFCIKWIQTHFNRPIIIDLSVFVFSLIVFFLRKS